VPSIDADDALRRRTAKSVSTETSRAPGAPEQNIEAESESGPQPQQTQARDPRDEVLRQIRLALILDGGLTGDAAQSSAPSVGPAGFDPYNSRTAPASGVWRSRRRDD
jgi:hypothetical protein